MNNFSFCNPVNIEFGKGSIARLTELVKPYNKIMMAYGSGSIKKNGVYDQVVDALKGKDYIEFSGIEPNPHYKTCLKAADTIKNENVDFILAVGGGSVVDAVKYIAAVAKFTGDDPWQIMTSHGEVVTAAMPFGAVLTLPATGSEMNFFSVISKKEADEKLAFANPLVYPVFSILDPETTYTLPKKQLRNGLVDAFAHVMEQYATYDVNSPLQDRQAEAIVNTLIEIAPDVLAEKPDYQARASLMWCATQALNGLIACGVVQDWATHMIGHELTAFFGVDHAESLAIVMPALWSFQKEKKKQKLAQLAERVFEVTGGSIDQKADDAINKTVEFFHSVNMPTRLKDYNISAEDIKKVVDRFAQRETVLGEHEDIDAEKVGQILQLCL
jgi:NADP-dependent alcohol dehydrogenase